MRDARRLVRRQLGAERLVPLLLFVIVGGGVALAFTNLFATLRERNIASGFGYLSHVAGFEIGETWISYSPQMTIGRALLVGLANTLVASVAISLFITLIGLCVGLVLSFGGTFSQAVVKQYVSVTRNVPALLHLIVWYAVFREGLPAPRAAYTLGSFVLSNRGLIVPIPERFGGWYELAITLSTAAALALAARLTRGRWSPFWVVASALVGLVVGYSQLPMNAPVLRGFNYRGGWVVTPEFCAIVLALGFYTGGYVTEIVRGAITTFPRGQVEGAFALGLSKIRFFLIVMTPQVVRGIAPAMVNQYVNVTKATSLGIAVGYPDLVSVSNTALNQTGQAVEAIALILVIYLAISLTVSFISERVFGDPAERVR